MDDPRDDVFIKAIADHVIEEIAAVFGPRHDLIVQRLNSFEQRIDAVEDRLDELGRLGVEIQRGATFTQMLSQETWAQTHPGEPMPQPPLPMPKAPRPQAVDEACAVPPGEPAKVVRLPRYGTTLVPEPGSDPATVWLNAIQSMTEGGGRGVRGSRRTRRH